MHKNKSFISFAAAVQLAAPHTWPAAILPVILGTAVACAGGAKLNVLCFAAVFIVAVLLQSAVNTLNDYADFVSGLDSADNCPDTSDAALIYQGVSLWDREDQAIEALARVGMEDRAHHRPAEMSGGQQQRVAIARAIATRPNIVMADEPTGALDSRTGLEVLDFLRQLNREGSTIILITHDNGIAATARRIVRLADGKIIEDREQEVDWL